MHPQRDANTAEPEFHRFAPASPRPSAAPRQGIRGERRARMTERRARCRSKPVHVARASLYTLPERARKRCRTFSRTAL